MDKRLTADKTYPSYPYFILLILLILLIPER